MQEQPEPHYCKYKKLHSHRCHACTIMKLAYPGSHESNKLDNALLALKIARHSSCSSCDVCNGLHPPPGVDVVLDDIQPQSSLVELGQYGSDDEDTPRPYLEICACGHGVMEHGVDETDVGSEEFLRRSRVAIRLDELLQVRDSLLSILLWLFIRTVMSSHR